MSINELSNEEVLFLYLNNRKWVEMYYDVINQKTIVDVLDILDFGNVTVTRFLNDEDVASMENSEHYRLTNLLNDKLAPLADLIQDADPELFEKVKSSFEKIEF
jgi:hypothetical protein